MRARLFALLLATTAAVSVWTVPGVARACSCGPSIELVGPAEVLAENETILFRAFCGGSLNSIEVLVDGQPVELVTDDDLTSGNYVAARLDPLPAEGQEVVVRACAQDFQEDCAPEDFEDVAALSVVEATPAYAVGVVELELTHLSEETQPGCDEPYDLTFDVQATIEDPGAPPRLYVVDLEAEGGRSFHRTGLVQDGTESLEFSISTREDDLMASPRDYCVTVTTWDLTGGASGSVTACDSTPEEQGCACRVREDASAPLWALLGFGGLLGLGRYRRRARD